VRIKLDENMPTTLVADLSAKGHDVDTVPQEGIAGHSDDTVWSAGQREARFLITTDLDFSDIRKFAPGTHHGVLLVRLAKPTRRALAARVRNVFQSEDVESWARCFVVATERKVRVRRPTSP
jgi:predicted nuclease of predicted toxin-antitoxin system